MQIKTGLTRPPLRSDPAGDGAYLAARKGRLHYGVDFYVLPNTRIYTEIDCAFSKMGMVYSGAAYKYLEFKVRDLHIRYLYVECIAGWNYAGQFATGDGIAITQDVAAHYPDSGMTNHVHVACFYKGNLVEHPDLAGAYPAYYPKRDRTYVNPLAVFDGSHVPPMDLAE